MTLDHRATLPIYARLLVDVYVLQKSTAMRNYINHINEITYNLDLFTKTVVCAHGLICALFYAGHGRRKTA